MTTSQIPSLSGALRAAKEVLARVPQTTARVVTEANELTTAVGSVDALADEMKQHTSELRGILATLTNG